MISRGDVEIFCKNLERRILSTEEGEVLGHITDAMQFKTSKDIDRIAAMFELFKSDLKDIETMMGNINRHYARKFTGFTAFRNTATVALKGQNLSGVFYDAGMDESNKYVDFKLSKS